MRRAQRARLHVHLPLRLGQLAEHRRLAPGELLRHGALFRELRGAFPLRRGREHRRRLLLGSHRRHGEQEEEKPDHVRRNRATAR